MANYTKNLNLFKYDTVLDSNVPFSITNALNNNWDILDERCGSQRNIGELIYTLIPLQDANLHLLDGTLLYSGVYSDFIDYIANLYAENPNANYFCTESDWQSSVSTYGVCGKFVYDSANNTVRLPKVTGKIDGTTDINALGDLEPLFVRLPNMTGYFGSQNASGTLNAADGTLFSLNMVTLRSPSTSSESYSYSKQVNFDASRSSSVYSGNGSDTAIHEQAIKCFIYIVITTSSKTEIQTDIDEVVTDLNGKADTDLSNINASQSAKNEIISWGMPDWNNKITITSVPFTAPSAGIVSLAMSYANAYPHLAIIINNIERTLFNPSSNIGGTFSETVIVDKNDIVSCTHFASSGTETWNYFVPLKGVN